MSSPGEVKVAKVAQEGRRTRELALRKVAVVPMVGSLKEKVQEERKEPRQNVAGMRENLLGCAWVGCQFGMISRACDCAHRLMEVVWNLATCAAQVAD